MGSIIWLASYPKSGNTWVRAFLHNLLTKDSGPADLNRMQGEILQGDSNLLWFQILDHRPISEWTHEDVRRMRPKVQELIANGQSNSVFCKTHNASMMVSGYPTINMGVSTGGIYIIRNPLDVAISLADFMGVSIDEAITCMANEYHESEFSGQHVPQMWGSWSQNVESWTGRPNPGLHIMRYEDMLENPMKAFGDLTGFLRVNTTPRQLRKAIERSSFKSLEQQERQGGFGEKSEHQKKFFRKGVAGQWKSELTDEQVARIWEQHKTHMTRFGYPLDGMTR